MDETETHTMPHNRNIALSLLVVNWCLEQVFRSLRVRARTDDVAEWMAMVFAAIASPTVSSTTLTFRLGMGGLRGYLKEHAEANESPTKGPDWERFLRVATYLCDYYVIVAPIPVAVSKSKDDLHVTVSASTVVARRDVQRGISALARRLLGVPVYRYRVPMPSAVETQTYHLRGVAPSGTYLYAGVIRYSEITNRPSELPRPAVAEGEPAAVSMLSPTFGSERLHVYTRALGKVIEPYTDSEDEGPRSSKPRGLYADVEFRPIPLACRQPSRSWRCTWRLSLLGSLPITTNSLGAIPRQALP